jgi:RNA polymerase sigma-70 factor (ECF subfamily)
MSAAMSLTDGQIMERVLAGQDEMFEELVQRHRLTMLRAAASKLGNTSLAEEAVQDAFLCAYAHRATFNPEHSFRGWLWTILLNVSRTMARREFGRVDRADGGRTSFSECEPVSEGDALKRILEAERSELLAQLLGSLSEAQADALRLRFFGGLKFEEIAQAMGCSLNGAKQRVRRGLENLAAAIRFAETDRR